MGSLRDDLVCLTHRKTDMANSTRRSRKVFTDPPGNLFEVPFLVERRINVAVFADFVYSIGRNIRSLVTFRAGMRSSRHLDGKLMARVASRTGSFASIRIDPSHPLVGPSAQNGKFHLPHVRLFAFEPSHLHFGPVAVEAGIGICLFVRRP